MKDKINVILNGKTVMALKGESILQLCKREGIEIPTLCHDERLEPYSSCFVCVVEVKGMRTLQPSCSTPVSEGMEIWTSTERVVKARKTALDLIMSNHYADCLAPCKQRCPAGVDVQGYISLIEKGLYKEAVGLIKEVNPLPAICGRVCVRPCEVACRRNLLDEGAAVGIDYLKRYAADQDLLIAEDHYKPQVAPSTGKKVAIIGAGPGGLSAAYFLQQKGHQCDIFEAAPKPGGWLRYGIPEYRLPNDVLDKEIQTITELGVNIYCGKKLGDNLSYQELKEEYDAVILTIGSQKGTLVGCEGDDAENVFSGIEFLRNMEITGQHYDFSGKKVVVVGGGNTAMDCCRTAIRCGSTDVTVVYRRTEKEMPANPIEIHESKLEGVKYMFLTNPKRINKDENGRVKSITCLKMKLGEPDASGRRRPIPIEGSEFDIEADYVLAAIGQKTDVNFLEDINKHLNGEGKLEVNRWGNIDCKPETLETGVKGIFAAGDGVTGPATIIEAIAQARIAARSCHQYLMGEEVKPPQKEFISRKDNFKPQVKEDYIGRFVRKARHEMPTLPPDQRVNFKEVELGYENEKVVQEETSRCLECGCVAYFDCRLKQYCDEYQVEQNRFQGNFHEYRIDFSHPYIEIDNNKCILCARCIRICKEVNGASALGLVNRGFDTYVAPALGKSLKDTECDSCGLCLSACPTGALSENTDFKPGPVKTTKVKTICNYCSVGCELNLHHTGGFVMKVTGEKGLVNHDGNICRFGKFGYQYINRKDRITKPLKKTAEGFKEISFDEAYDIIVQRIKAVKKDKNAFYAGARLTNEEQYLVQKLARHAVGTNHVNSFYYLHGDWGYVFNSEYNTPFEEIRKASKIYLAGAELNADNAVVGFMVQNTRFKNSIPVELITEKDDSSMKFKVDRIRKVKSYYYFFKAVNHYILSEGLENSFFLKSHMVAVEEYKQRLLSENFEKLLEKAGVSKSDVESFAREYNEQINAIIIFAEKEICSNTSFELQNLAILTGKISKTASGLISLKEKNNAHGLLDMGVNNKFGVGTQMVDNADFRKKVKKVWGVNLPELIPDDHIDYLKNGFFKNIFIFGEDPVGCAFHKEEVKEWLSNAEFLMVQDAFMTETARMADLILPSSFHFESGGSFTNTQKFIQEFDAVLPSPVEKVNYRQLLDILSRFKINGLNNLHDIQQEIYSLLPSPDNTETHKLQITNGENRYHRFFDYGCDFLTKLFDEEFNEKLKSN